MRWQRLTPSGVLAALAVAPLVSLSIVLQPDWQAFWGNPVIPATLSSLLTAVWVSLLSKPVRISRPQALALLASQRVVADNLQLKPQPADAGPAPATTGPRSQPLVATAGSGEH